MDERLDAWLVPLKEMIEKINSNYSHFFTRLGCNGAVELNIPEEKAISRNCPKN